MKQLYKKLQGTGVALVTPFLKNGAVDSDSFRKLILHVLKGGCEYIVVTGTTGESVTLEKKEINDLLALAVKTVAGKIPVVFGSGGNNTMSVLQNLEKTDFKGVDAVLSVAPYYNKPSQAGIMAHYREVARNCPVPVLLYNVPGRTGTNLLPQNSLELSTEKNIIGIKEASGNPDQVMMILRERPENFLVISGDDNLTLPYIACGADGVISVIANAYPKQYSEMVRICLRGDFKKARDLHYRLYPLIPMLFAEGNPSGIKAALDHLGVCGEFQRLPMVPVSRKLYREIGKVITSI